jgi:hypothetical protein
VLPARQLYAAFTRVLGWSPPHLPLRDRSTTWIHRIQREDNLWLRAVALEHQGLLSDACALYLQDADQQAARGLHAHAALACVAAAEVAFRAGDPSAAQQALERAGAHFRLHAERAAQWSLREAAWAYDRAAAVYEAVGLTRTAGEMRRYAEQSRRHLSLPLDGLGDGQVLRGGR